MTTPTHWSETPIEPSLLEGLRRGEPRAREQVYQAFSSCVFTMALRMTQSRPDAMDCTQDAFIKVFEHAHQFRGPSPFWAWVRRIALNTIVDRLRLRQRDLHRHASTTETIANQLIDPSPSLELTESRQTELLEAYRTLSPTARTVVWMHDVEGMPHQDIAEHFDRSLSFSKTTLLRARRHMRAYLQSRLGQDGQSTHELMTEH